MGLGEDFQEYVRKKKAIKHFFKCFGWVLRNQGEYKMNLGILGYIWSLFYLVCHFNLKNSQNVKKNHMFSEMVHLRIHFVAKIICRLLYIQVCNLFSRLNWKKSPKMKNWCLSSNEISLEIGAHWQAYMTYGYFRHLRAAFFISFFFTIVERVKIWP